LAWFAEVLEIVPVEASCPQHLHVVVQLRQRLNIFALHLVLHVNPAVFYQFQSGLFPGWSAEKFLPFKRVPGGLILQKVGIHVVVEAHERKRLSCITV
jgi:hypothetical protein